MLVRVNVGSDYQERYTLDSSFRVTSTIRTIGSRTYTTSYTRNQASQATQLTYPSSRAINISHDSIGRLSGITEQPGNGPTWLSSVTYNNIGQMTADALGNGVTEQYGYDANRMQLTSQKAGTSSPYTNRMDLTYSYAATSGQMGSGSTAGNAGQLMSISGTINGTTESAAYTYDTLERLVTSNQTSNGSSAQRRFAYDRWSNRTGMWDATSGGTQIQSITLHGSGGIPTNQIASVSDEKSSVNYTYDAAGNVTNDGVHSYGYDSENRIVSVDGGSTASYAYDHQNRRYKKTIGSAVTHYVWLGSKVLAEHNGSTGAVLTDYVYSGGRMIAKVEGGTTQYFLSDRLSTRLVLDTSGNVLGRQAHLPFGEDFGESGTQEKHQFTSYERDAESGTDYAVNRQYSHIVGGFNRPDPKRSSCKSSEPQSANRYGYTRNDPVNSMDPLGLDEVFADPFSQHPINYNILCRLFPEYCNINFSGVPFEVIREVVSEVAEPVSDALSAVQGTLFVNATCQNVIYKPEDPPSAPWRQADFKQIADAVGTPKGIVKIADGCICSVDCGEGKDYEIHCLCVWGPVPGQRGKPKTLDPGSEFADPRNVGFSWIPDKTTYTRTKAKLGAEWWFK